MTWTLSNLIIQLVTGIVGGNAAAAVAKEHGFGMFGHTVAGAVGGGLSGYFLQTVVTLFIGSGGGFVEATAVENAIIQGLTGASAGAVMMLVVGFLKQQYRPAQGAKKTLIVVDRWRSRIMVDVTIYHNPACGTSRNVLALIRNGGVESTIVEYLEMPLARSALVDMIAKAGLTVRDAVHTKGTPYYQLGLDGS